MDGNQVRVTRCRSGRLTPLKWVLFTFALVGAMAGASIEASPIRNRSLRESGVRAASVSSGLTWPEFLKGGQALWAKTQSPRFPSDIHLASVNGKLVETPFVQYLLWRRSLDPARFDAHHPRISGPLAQVIRPPTTPTTPPSSIPPQEQVVTPEPSAIFIALIMSGGGIVFAERARRRGALVR